MHAHYEAKYFDVFILFVSCVIDLGYGKPIISLCFLCLAHFLLAHNTLFLRACRAVSSSTSRFGDCHRELVPLKRKTSPEVQLNNIHFSKRKHFYEDKCTLFQRVQKTKKSV